MRVREDLDFDVARLDQIFFEVEARVAEGVHGFGGGVAIGGGEVGVAGDEAHAFSATAGNGFEQDRETHGLRQGLGFFGLLDGIVGAGNGGDVGTARKLAAGGFRAEGFHGFGGWGR